MTTSKKVQTPIPLDTKAWSDLVGAAARRACSLEVVYREGMEPPRNDLALAACWHRVDAAVQRVRDGVNSAHPYECPSAVADTLDALYDLWDLWCTEAALKSWKAQDECVKGDASGETAAALMFARGSKTHAFVTFGDLTDTFTDTFNDLFGCWRWQPYSDKLPKYASRNDWFGARVSGREVLPPLVDAIRWFRRRPELNS